MRTTLTLDDEVAVLLRKESQRSGEAFKQTVNRCLRMALTTPRGPSAKTRFRVTPIDLQVAPGVDIDKASSILEALEVPLYR